MKKLLTLAVLCAFTFAVIGCGGASTPVPPDDQTQQAPGGPPEQGSGGPAGGGGAPAVAPDESKNIDASGKPDEGTPDETSEESSDQ